MDKAVTATLCLFLLSAEARAEERLGVFEFFGRTTGSLCQGAAPDVISLQRDLAGRAVLLEYAYDTFNSGRITRWWDAYSGTGTVYLPLITIGSGFSVCQGTEHPSHYRAMLEAELARPAEASIHAWSRRSGSGMQIFVRAENSSAKPLTADQLPTLWAIAWEDARIGLTDTWVRATSSLTLSGTLPPGGVATATIDLPAVPANDWSRIRSLVLLDHRPAGSSRYDLLQASISRPAALEVTPGTMTLDASKPEAEVAIDGPHVLSWSATPDVPWLEVSPTSGGVPSVPKVRLVGSPSPSDKIGTIRLAASGGGMDFSATVTVNVTATDPPSWVGVVPAAAHAPGTYETYWRTDVAAVNLGSESATVEVTFVPVTGEPVVRTETLDPGGAREWNDVLVSLIGLEMSASASGALHFASSQALSVSSRTFTEDDTGSFGGFLPAIKAGQGLTPGRTGVLPQLRRGPFFRTNIGVTNLGEVAASVTIRLRGRTGEALGEPLDLTVTRGSLNQIVDAFDLAGAGDQDVAFATVEVTTPGAVIWAYASVIDNRTGDPSIVPLDIP
jgi:hypothetical protein